MNKILYIVRGLPGSGKSTFSATLGCPFYEADMYFVKDGEYKFDASKLQEAHNWCRHAVMDAMKMGIDKIAVSNTFTRSWEMESYYLMAENLGYTVISLIVENRHGGLNKHNVPDNKIQSMKDRFEIKL